MRIIRKEEYRKTFWSGGCTTEIYLYPEEGDYGKRQFDYRISSATIETEESVFTVLPGIARVILPLDNTMVLFHGEAKIVLSPYEPYGFDGGMRTKSRGINRDFNLMMNHGKTGSVVVLIIDGETSIIEEAENTLYFYDKGTVPLGVGGMILDPGDSILIEKPERIEWVNHSPEQVILLKAVMEVLSIEQQDE